MFLFTSHTYLLLTRFLSNLIHRYSLTNNVYKSLQDNNEDQCIVMLGESSSGKTENCRMIIRFLSKISGRFIPLQRQRSSNSIASFKSSPKSSCSTPKHNNNNKSSASTLQHSVHEKSTSCFKTATTMDGNGSVGRNKKVSRVEFDFSMHRENDESTTAMDALIKYCPKHNCCNVSSSSSTTSTNPIEIPVVPSKRSNKNHYHHHSHHPSSTINEIPAISKSFTIYETMNRVHNSKKVPNYFDNYPKEAVRCESLDLIKISSQQNCTTTKDKVKLTNFNSSFEDTIQQLSKLRSSTDKSSSSTIHLKDSSYDRSKINLDNFKSAKRKVPIKNLKSFQLTNLELQAMKERIAQAEVFLEAMGNALTSINRDSSRYVSRFFTTFLFWVHIHVLMRKLKALRYFFQ